MGVFVLRRAGPLRVRGIKGLATHLQRARSSFAIAQQLAQVRGLLRLQVRFARIKQLLKEPEAQRVPRLSLCQSLGHRVIWRLACSALLNGLAPPHKPHATDLHRRGGRSDVGGLDVEGCARRKRQHAHVSMRRHTHFLLMRFRRTLVWAASVSGHAPCRANSAGLASCAANLPRTCFRV